MWAENEQVSNSFYSDRNIWMTVFLLSTFKVSKTQFCSEIQLSAPPEPFAHLLSLQKPFRADTHKLNKVSS